MKKVSLLLILAMVVNLMGCSCAKPATTVVQNNNYITRGSWVETVAPLFGMTEYVNDTPYFEDVNQKSDLFAYVQACYEWGVISTDTHKFKADEVATLGFAACSIAMILSGGESVVTNEQLLEYCETRGLITKNERSDSLSAGLTPERANTLLAMAEAIYFADNVEIVNDVKVNEKLEDYSKLVEDISYVSENVYIVTAELAAKLSYGDIIAVPGTDIANDVVALKVKDVSENEDGTYTVQTLTPEFEEVFDYIDISGTRYADYKNFVPEDGVTVTPIQGEVQSLKHNIWDAARVTTLTNVPTKNYNTESNEGMNFSIGVSVNSSNKIELSAKKDNVGIGFDIDDEGKILIKQEQEDMSILNKMEVELSSPDKDDETLQKFLKEINLDVNGVTNNNTSNLLKDYGSGIISRDQLLNNVKKDNVTKKLDTESVYKTGWALSGEIKVNNLAVTPDVQFGEIFGVTNIADFKYMSIRVTGDIEVNIEYSGKIEGEVKVGTLYFPTGIPGLAIVLDCYMYLEANGSVAVKFKSAISASVECKKGAGIRSANDTIVENSIEANASIQSGTAFSASLYLLGFDITSFKVKVGIQADVELKIEQQQEIEKTEEQLTIREAYVFSGGLYIYLPIVTIEVNKTKNNILSKLGFTATIELINSKGLKEKGQEITVLEVEDKVLYEMKATIYFDETEDDNASGGVYLSLNKLAINMHVDAVENLVIENYPEGYTEADIVWESNNESVVTVYNGKLVAEGSGNAIVTAKTTDGNFNATCLVYVIE